MCEYCSHKAAAACIDALMMTSKRSWRGSCVTFEYIHKGRRAYQENDKRRSRSHNIVKYRMTQGDVHCFVVYKHAPRVILKPLPIARLWETRKFLDLVRESIKILSLPVFWEELIDWKAVEDHQHTIKAHEVRPLTKVGIQEIRSVAHNAEDGVKKLWYSQDTIHGLLCST